MAVAYTAVAQSGLLSHQYPPPLLPKPGKDNIRLQKLLKRTAKKKAAAQVSQSAAPFRSSLSPVNEASPDLEHSDHSTPPRTPETPYSFYSHQPPRFSVKPVKTYQHVASPYPQRAALGRGARFSPLTVGPSLNTQPISSAPSYPTVPPATQIVTQPPAPKIPTPTSLLDPTAVEVRKPAFITVPAVARAQSPGFYTTGLAETRPLTVLTPIVKSKSPRPTFKANEQSRSPKPLFDVPQIRNYTASTSYYETSRTPPVYDTATLMSIGSTVMQNKTEVKRDLTPTSEVRRGGTPTAPSMGADQQRRTPTIENKKGTTPTQEVQNRTPTSEIQKATPEIKRATPTSEPKRTTPTTEISVKTTYDSYQASRIAVGRPRTPAFRPTTPSFEISRPNPLLFAVSPITVEQERSRTPKSTISDISVQSSEVIPNGDAHPTELPEPKLVHETIVKSKSEPDLSRVKIQAAPVDTETLTSDPLPTLPTQIYQRSKTPTFEATRLMSTVPGYKRPRTPTQVMSLSRASPVSFQRPKTPTQVAQKSSKSSYRGLTPAEYAAYGGIKTFSPAYGIATSMTITQEEVKLTTEEEVEAKTLIQEVSIVEVSKPKESTIEVDIPQTVAIVPSVPIIVVTQASEVIVTTTKQDKSTVSNQIVEKTPVIQETPKAPPPKEEEITTEKEVAKESPKWKPPQPKPQPKKDDQDPMKAVRKLFGKDKAPATEQKATPETMAKVEQKEETKPPATSETKYEDTKPTALPFKMAAGETKSEDTKQTALPFKMAAAESKISEEEKKVEPAPADQIEKKEEDGALEAEPLLKSMLKPKGLKSKMSGWSRLKKHMVVEQEEPKFPGMGGQNEATVLDTVKTSPPAEEKAVEIPAVDSEAQATDSDAKDGPKATKMWDAVLFQMFSTKENIMAQIEMNKTEDEKTKEKIDGPVEVPSFAHRLPVLLFSPRFDAKKLREAASRPVTKISTVFEMGLIGRKGKDEEPKDFNRTARGFAAS